MNTEPVAGGNVFAGLPAHLPQEVVENLLQTGSFRLERIISTGQATPAGQWYDQDAPEWVILLSGGAGLRFESEAQVRTLAPGDYVLIPAHCRHRVEWTDPDRATVWLALHFEG